MIDKIRKQLVYKYTAIMFIMLLIVFACNFFVISYIITQKHLSSLEKYLFEEVDEASTALVKNNVEIVSQFFDDDNENATNTFTYWFDRNNNPVLQLGLSKQINEKKINLMQNWPHEEEKLININLLDDEDDEWNMIMTYKDIYSNNGSFLGKVFVGKNITPLRVIRQTYSYLIFIMLAIMIILIFIFANRMAEKAMIPITEAFEKQNKFVANASHEIRTPLSVMLSSIDLIEAKSKENIEIKNNIKAEILNIRELVNELLELARYDVNKNELNTHMFDLTKVAKEVIKSIKLIAKSKNITIHFTSNNSYKINADENKIKQLIYILSDNAIKYSECNTNIFISLSNDKSFVHFTIKDEGIGIIASEQEHIFSRFYRVNKARSRSKGGAGLGLSIALEIINLHNGAIKVESDGTNGSTFSFSLKR